MEGVGMGELQLFCGIIFSKSTFRDIRVYIIDIDLFIILNRSVTSVSVVIIVIHKHVDVLSMTLAVVVPMGGVWVPATSASALSTLVERASWFKTGG
jgi:hypothetical protein